MGFVWLIVALAASRINSRPGGEPQERTQCPDFLPRVSAVELLYHTFSSRVC